MKKTEILEKFNLVQEGVSSLTISDFFRDLEADPDLYDLHYVKLSIFKNCISFKQEKNTSDYDNFTNIEFITKNAHNVKRVKYDPNWKNGSLLLTIQLQSNDIIHYRW